MPGLEGTSGPAPVTGPVSFESMKLQVGMRLQMTQRTSGRDRVSYTALIGYVPNEFLLMRVPQENGLSIPVVEGETIRFRVFCGLSVYSFSSEVETIFLSPRNYMVLSFPREIAALALRRSMRVRVDMPVMLNSNATAVLSDLSVTGAQVTAEMQMACAGDRLSMAFSFRTKPANTEVRLQVDGVVQSVRQRPSREAEAGLVDHGVLFDSLGENDAVMLQNFVYEMLLENRGL